MHAATTRQQFISVMTADPEFTGITQVSLTFKRASLSRFAAAGTC